MEAPDRGQWEELRAGDREACARFVGDQYAALYRWLCRLTGRSDLAADLTQGSFAAFWESLRRGLPGVAARTWLFSIGRNQWRKHCRDQAKRDRQETGALDRIAAPEGSAWSDAEREEFGAALESAVGELSAEFREVFVLRLWHEFDYAEIAAIQRISADLARWRFFRARQQVRARLKAWEDAEETRT